ncbi:MAG: hypothetical protein KF746_26630 [Chitinophagaceae bacterium]|nr:hypothetical protein [Chitinophagaceae bacterium]
MKVFILIISGFLFFGCNSGTNHENEHGENNASVAKTLSDSLYKSVMEGHDRGMAKMGEIVRYKKLAQQKKDALTQLKSKGTLQLSTLDSVIHDLDYAETIMNKWMHEFDPDKAGNTEEEKTVFYKKEKEKVDTVEARINNSIQKARQIFIP